MKISLINNTIGNGEIESKSYELKTTIKANNRSHNLLELNANKQLMNLIHQQIPLG